MPHERKPHAPMDLDSRRHKALKIHRILGINPAPAGRRMLEIGTGSGGIAHYFATQAELGLEVDAVDVVDQRGIREGYRFARVQGTNLPFADAEFDYVISNHVIEHVGDLSAQMQHLAELRRVLKPEGVGYLAVPNRWMLIEPHYRLVFLSWLPHALRTPYLRLMRKGTFYDCEPLQMRQLERMLDAAHLSHRNCCVPAWRVTLEIESPNTLGARLLAVTPDRLLAMLHRVIPTLIYRVEPLP